MTDRTGHETASRGEPHILHLLQLTDTHLPSGKAETLFGIDTAASLARVVALARQRAEPVDAILATGDLGHDCGEAGYRRLAALLEPLRAPIWWLPGNHDDLQAMARVLPEATGYGAGALLAGQWQILLLSSRLPGSDGGLFDASELARCDRQLRRHPQRPALVCLHHHPVPVGSPWMDRLMLANARQFFAVIDRHPQVRGIVWGHIHQAFEGSRKSVALLGTPSTCVQFAPHSEHLALDTRPPGYRCLALHPDGAIHSRVVRLGDDRAPAGQTAT